MDESISGTPITRAEFEAGVKFYHSPKLNPFDELDIYQKNKEDYSVLDKKSNFYCLIQFIDEKGFKVYQSTFGKSTEVIVLFKDCYKAQKQ